IDKIVELQHYSRGKKRKEEIRDTIYIHNILFEFDKNVINDPVLDILAEYLKNNPKAIIEIGGHADSNGPEIYNIHLSLRRAIYINNYLIDKGVSPAALIVKGYGEKYPLIPNDIPDGAEYDSLHKFNRRVDFKVIREGKQVLIINEIPIPEYLKNHRDDDILDNLFADNDNDGVLNKDDNCIDQAGPVNNGGCPEVKEEVKEVMKKAMEGLFFNPGSDIIKKSSYKVLNNVVEVMESNPGYKLSIKGHTDNQGKADFNLELSQKRADAAKNYLIGKGIDSRRIQTKGFGMSMPVAPNNTREGRKKNRRVEFEIVF
ncbi:MAG: hypothetical protein C0594_12550, partial [Marinilabiliales bacterium]